MKKKILISCLFFYLMTSYSMSSKILSKNRTFSNNPFITIIFKARTFKNDTVYSSSGEKAFKKNNLYYSIIGSFIKYDIQKKNYKKDDTLKIYTNNDIILSHDYYFSYYSMYRFKPGDIVEFDYPNEFPVCKILNRKLTDLDLNFITTLNIKTENIDSPSLFFLKNKRFRTNEENAVVKELYKKQISLKEKKIDSLYNSGLLNTEFYELTKKDLTNKIYDDKTNKENLLLTTIDLSLESSRQRILMFFNSLHKPTSVKNDFGTFPDFRVQFENVIKEENITAINKDFLLYSFMIDIITKLSNNDIENYFEKFKININNKELIKFIDDKFHLKEKKNNLPYNAVVMNENKEQFELSELIKNKYKNKVVYIDFWASWCAPCRAAIPGSKKLQEIYKNKDVAFLFVSIDDDAEKWLSASKKENLSSGGNNFWAKNYPIDSLYKELEIKSIPRYLIYDKKGKLVHTNAPNPNNNLIISELNKYLSE